MLMDINILKVNPDLQIREEGSDPSVVSEYAKAMTDGAIFPPITVFFDGSRYYIADGFHRFAAAKQINLDVIDADVHEGSKRDAILYAVGANAENGVRRTNADKHKAVMKLLNDKEWNQWSDNQIAKFCKVNHETVGRLRLKSLAETQVSERSYKTKHGTVATMNTAKIGTSKKKEQPTEPVIAESVSQQQPPRFIPAVAPPVGDYQEPLDKPEEDSPRKCPCCGREL